MRLQLLHNAVPPDAGPEEEDVLVQVAAITEVLAAAGHTATAVPCDLDLEALRRRLETDRPDLVFNLVESLGGFDRLLFLVPALLDALDIPYTGTLTAPLLRATDKLATKEALLRAGLPVPACLAVWPAGDPAADSPWSSLVSRDIASGPVILKPVWDHGSPTLDDASVLPSAADLDAALARAIAGGARGPLYAEPFIAGREINVTLLAGADGVEALPPVEIVFADFPPDKPRIVGFRAKWQVDSFEYSHTVRRLDFPPEDRELLAELSRLARAAFVAVGLAGYGRVDFRVDEAGQPFILEVNANPCLSPDAGFAAAATAAGLDYGQAICRILDAAVVSTAKPQLATAQPRGPDVFS